MTSDPHTDEPLNGDEPEAAAGELARRCGRCQAVIPAEFFVLGSMVVCPACASGIEHRHTGRGRVRHCLLWGGLAAAILASLWYLATVASGRPLAGVAVLAGVGVGLAVHWGANRRGGLRYQVVAALLVYAVFIARYVPPVFGGVADAIKRQQATATESAPRDSGGEAGAASSTAGPPGAASRATTNLAGGSSWWVTFKAYFVFAAVAWVLVLASPFLPGSLGVLSLVCLALGMAAAAVLNRRIRVRGPFPGPQG